MVEENFLKIIYMDFNNLTCDNLDKALYFNFLQGEYKNEELFYKNFEFALDYFINKNKLSLINNEELLIKIITYYYCLYGDEKINEILSFLNLEYDYLRKIQFCMNVRRNGNRKDIVNNYNLEKLEIYYKYRLLKKKYNDIDESVFKEAFYILFDVDNFLERYNSILKKREFIKKHQISEQTFKNYVCIYGLLNTPIKSRIEGECNRRLRSYDSYGVVSSNINEDISTLVNTYDMDKIKKIVYNTHISEATIYLIFEHNNIIKEKYADRKMELIEKVNKANLELEKELKYTDASKVLSIIEKTDDDEFIYKLIKNCPTKKFNVISFIDKYRLLKSFEEKRNLEQVLKNKISKVINKIKYEENIKKQNNKQINKVLSNLNMLLENPTMTLSDYAKKIEVSQGFVQIGLKMLQENDLINYNIIKNRDSDISKRKKEDLNWKVKQICEYIINGIKLENGEIKEFDILDYYLNCNLKSFEFNKIVNNINSYSINEIRKIKQFLKKISPNDFFNIEKELNSKTLLLINSCVYEVTKDEKISTIEFLKENNVPLEYGVYNVTLRRLINRTLPSQSQNNINILKKA